MTGLCLIFTIGAVILILQGRGVLAFFALFAFAPGLAIGWRQIRSGGYFVRLDRSGLVRNDYGVRQEWRWEEFDRCVADTRHSLTGVWCRIKGGDYGDEIVIEPGKRNVEALAQLFNRYQDRAYRIENRD